ncbi:hypothetical protein KQ313_08210 [Synechococcus sp. CS-1325]|uniref:hypothetical protein n=1 Tax=Synechococcus sp. CS-1325 TaxID=2847979 RepID=UPI000DB2504D|nr:hypothetical protein [Synechococcus sp. CS-1325]MCT0199658.1 hypothetical protein [Synechococcus sp. CS-1325]PZV00301.1 MAG: hypothetical protein DCF24_07360 [Cyanobium sp.]
MPERFPGNAPTGRREQLERLFGAALGFTAAYLISSHLDTVPSTLLSSITLAGGATLAGRMASPLRWWALLGSAAGCLLGNATVLARALQESEPQANLATRVVSVVLLAAAGSLAGLALSTRHSLVDRQPKDLLRSASALTTGLFAVLVTFAFLHGGLDTARTFSSRLSTSLTILVASLSVPGWLTHLITHPRLPQADD